MNRIENVHEVIENASKRTGVPIKKIKDFLFLLRNGNPIENNELLQKVGVSKNALNLAKELLSTFLKPPSKTTQLDEEVVKKVEGLFTSDYQQEEALWKIFEDKYYDEAIRLLSRYANHRPTPAREYDQFTATIETTAKRANLLNFFEDVGNKNILFLGDDDFTSVVTANLKTANRITVLDIDRRILDSIKHMSRELNLEIETVESDIRKPLPASLEGQFDVVFTDPPYTPEGIKLFVSRAVEALNRKNLASRIYVCYGNSDRAKERFLPIQEILTDSGLMFRFIFDKFNRYKGAESIGSSSSLYIVEVTPKSKPLVKGNYDKPIYTTN